MKYILTFLIIIGLCFGGYYIWEKKNSLKNTSIVQENQDSVIAYISKNIANLSPKKVSNGGTFYVTNIVLDGDTGSVEYEDGQNSYTATFGYMYSSTGEVQIKDFVITQ